MVRKVFSLEEANKLIPKLKVLFEKIFELQDKINNFNFITQEVFDMLQEIEILVEKISQLGCIVKDVREGLVDFYYMKDKELVFLCWKYGEDEIKNWHGMKEGFDDRKPIQEVAELF